MLITYIRNEGVSQISTAAVSSAVKLLDTLKNLDYIYPYCKDLGFCLEKAGMENRLLEPFMDMGLEFDFYLDHQIEDTAYSDRWRLYYPNGL